MDKLFKEAVNQLGQKEIEGPDDNPVIANYAKESDFEWESEERTPWCSIFLNWCASRVGLEKSGEPNARSWLMVGEKVDQPEPGDIVVLWRESINSWKGHVGILFGFSKDMKRVYILGGNQGNQVSIAGYPCRQILGFRRLRMVDETDLGDRTLRMGDTGDDVKALQDALKSAGFVCGTSDGIFGPKTERAVRTLQSTQTNLQIDGVFGEDTRDYLIHILKNK